MIVWKKTSTMIAAEQMLAIINGDVKLVEKPNMPSKTLVPEKMFYTTGPERPVGVK